MRAIAAVHDSQQTQDRLVGVPGDRMRLAPLVPMSS